MDDIELLIKQMSLGLKNAMELAPISVRLLAEIGWYMDMRMNPVTLNKFTELINNGQMDHVDNEMINWIDNDASKILDSLIAKYPHREAVIKAGIQAHIKKKYYLSVPIFFSQAEGICREVTKYRFFKIKKRKPSTAEWKGNYTTDNVVGILLEPLKTIGRTRAENRYSDGLNRHAVLHGECSDYGEDGINSYKSLSLLNYIGLTLDHLKRETTVVS